MHDTSKDPRPMVDRPTSPGMSDPRTISDRLLALGYTHRPDGKGNGYRQIVNAAGEVVATHHAGGAVEFIERLEKGGQP